MWYTIVLAFLFYITNRISYENGKERGAVEMGEALFDELVAKGYANICRELFNE